MMSEREADLAIGVGPPGSFGAGSRRRHHDGRIPRREWERVVVPSKQHRLKEDRKNAKESGSAPRRRQLRLALPIPRGEAQKHVSPIPLGRPALECTIHYNTNPRSPFAVPRSRLILQGIEQEGSR